jgi:hypothetical protein
VCTLAANRLGARIAAYLETIKALKLFGDVNEREAIESWPPFELPREKRNDPV